jgi:xanthine dehydrogenase accessory factor
MTDWLADLADCRRRGVAAVLVTVAAVRGSAPRDPGARMVVGARQSWGTIGGGQLEHLAGERARRLLEEGDTALLQRVSLGASLGQCCGGVVDLQFERVAPDTEWVETALQCEAGGQAAVIVGAVEGEAARHKLIVLADEVKGSLGAARQDAAAIARARRMLAAGGETFALAALDDGGEAPLMSFAPLPRPAFRLLLFGAGHVGRAVVQVLAGLPCRIDWIDEREDAFPAQLPANVRRLAVDAVEAEVDAAPAGAHYLVMTHSHALDQCIAERILRRGDFAWFGLIGSDSKRRAFVRRLAARGLAPQAIARMRCPIGIAGIRDKHPLAIAIAVAAEILRQCEAGTDGVRFSCPTAVGERQAAAAVPVPHGNGAA